MSTQLHHARLTLTSVGSDAAEDLLPAYNGDIQFNAWNGTETMSLDAVKADIIEASSMPGGTIWRIDDSADTLVGVAVTALVPQPSSAWVALLVIREPFQRQGLGTAAASLLEEYLFGQPGIVHIGLGVLTQNTPALAFWEGRGYRRGLKRRDNHDNEIYTLRLDHPQGSDHLSRVREQFGATAANYVTSQTHREGADLDHIVELVSALPPGDRIALDIATGGGHTAFALAFCVSQVIASDVTPQMLAQVEAGAISRGLDNVTTALANAEALPWPDDEFDVVTSRIAPHHFGNLAQAVHEMARVTKPGGLLIVVDSVVPEEADLDSFLNTVEKIRDTSHVRSRSESEWRDLFSQAGLTITDTQRYAKTHDYADWVARANVSPETLPTLTAAFLAASDAAKVQFAIVTEGDQVISYTDEKLLIAGKK